MNAKEKAELIEKAIRITWSSLSSHLPYTHEVHAEPEHRCSFHKKCVKEYAEIIAILSKLY